MVAGSCGLSKRNVGIGPAGIVAGGGCIMVGAIVFSVDSLAISVVGGVGSTNCTADAIFLNFLCKYVPSDSSHLCSTGSTAGVVLTGEGERRGSDDGMADVVLVG